MHSSRKALIQLAATIMSIDNRLTSKVRGETNSMKTKMTFGSCALVIAFSATPVFAQAFGEYGRAVGSIPHGQGITGSRSSGGVTQGNAGSGGVGDVSGRALPTRLVVSVKNAGLFPRQDDESGKIAQLSQGESLVPMVQNAGGSEWYMVRTQKGLVGWVKSSDVRADKVKK